jgi:uncharacterized protein YheU (UPF0270 family)
MNPKQASPDGTEAGVELDPAQLSPGALRGLVEEFVTREGTDYGGGDWTLEEKVAEVFAQLKTGAARIVFDLQRESASIVASDEPAAPPMSAAAS